MKLTCRDASGGGGGGGGGSDREGDDDNTTTDKTEKKARCGEQQFRGRFHVKREAFFGDLRKTDSPKLLPRLEASEGNGRAP